MVGWVVDGSVVSVVLLRRGPDGVPLPLTAWVPDNLDRLLRAVGTAPDAHHEVVPVGRTDLPVLVRVVRVPVGSAELVISDLGRADGARWAELRTPAGAGCALPPTEERRLDAAGPAVDADGAGGGLVVGASLPDLVTAGLASSSAAAAVADAVTGSCVVVAPGPSAPPGVSSLVVQDGSLAGVGLIAGSVHPEGGVPLAVGDPVDRVPGAFPGHVDPGGLRALRDNSGLVVRLTDSRVVVSVARPSAVVDDVDVPVLGEPLVAGLQVTRGC